MGKRRRQPAPHHTRTHTGAALCTCRHAQGNAGCFRDLAARRKALSWSQHDNGGTYPCTWHAARLRVATRRVPRIIPSGGRTHTGITTWPRGGKEGPETLIARLIAPAQRRTARMGAHRTACKVRLWVVSPLPPSFVCAGHRLRLRALRHAPHPPTHASRQRLRDGEDRLGAGQSDHASLLRNLLE